MLTTNQKDTSWTFHALNASGKPNTNKSVPMNTLSTCTLRARFFQWEIHCLGNLQDRCFYLLRVPEANPSFGPSQVGRELRYLSLAKQEAQRPLRSIPGHFTKWPAQALPVVGEDVRALVERASEEVQVGRLLLLSRCSICPTLEGTRNYPEISNEILKLQLFWELEIMIYYDHS